MAERENVFAQGRSWSRRHFLGAATAVAGAGAGLAGCGTPGNGGSSTPGAPPKRGSVAGSARTARTGAPVSGADAALIAQRYGGLKPFPAPPAPPAVKPVDLNVAQPPVISRIPTDRKIVFVTIDDGLEKDPAFIQMVKDFRVPFTLFLTDAIIKNDYAYFTALLDTGMVTIQNHTLTHRNLPSISAAQQLDEVGGQQEKLIKEYGASPYLFRPPYGNYNHATVAAVEQTSGLKGIMVWKETMQVTDMQYQGARRLQPGDVILSHFRGPAQLSGETMVGMMTNLFKHVQQQGFTIAKLTDYI
jgi:peptidoglycan/xylan/chitin deacetylase (PgdA/CDA1 family)